MSTTNQAIIKDTRAHRIRLLLSLEARLRKDGLKEILPDLPSYRTLDIALNENNDLSLYFGRRPDPSAPFLELACGKSNWHSFKERTDPSCQRPRTELVDMYTKDSKAPFNWAYELWEGLLQKPPMTHKSQALLKYYLLQWAAKDEEAGGRDFSYKFEFDYEYLIGALSMVGATHAWRDYEGEKRWQDPELEMPDIEGSELGESEIDVPVGVPHSDDTESEVPESEVPESDVPEIEEPEIEPQSSTHTSTPHTTQITPSPTPNATQVLLELARHTAGANLPPISGFEIRLTPSPTSATPVLRLRVAQCPAGPVWASLATPKGPGLNAHPCLEIETAPGRMREIKLVVKKADGTFSSKNAGEPDKKVKADKTDTPDVKLMEPFHSGRSVGAYLDPALCLVKWYLFVAHQEKGVDIKPGDHINKGKWMQYLGNACKSYREGEETTGVSSQSQPRPQQSKARSKTEGKSKGRGNSKRR